MVSFAFLRLLIFLLAILIPVCASSSPAFLMMYSAYKLTKQGDNIHPWRTPFPIWNQSVIPCPVLTVAPWPAYRFLKRQVSLEGVYTCIYEVKRIREWFWNWRGFGNLREHLVSVEDSRLFTLDQWFLCKMGSGSSLMIQGLRTGLPKHGTWIRSLVRKHASGQPSSCTATREAVMHCNEDPVQPK